MGEDTSPRRKLLTWTSLSSPPDLKFNTHSRPPLICQELVLSPCLALKFSSVNLMNTRRKFSHPLSPRELPWKPVSLASGTSTPPRSLASTHSDSPHLEIS